jgi:hypothetical protein
MTDDSRNGSAPDDTDDLPLDADEAAAGAEVAGEAADESLDERIGTACEALDGVTRAHDGDLQVLAVAGRVFAVVGTDSLEVALEGPVAKAALATPDTRPSPRGPGWVAFAPATTDRFALDRAEAWLRFAHRRAAGRDRAN